MAKKKQETKNNKKENENGIRILGKKKKRKR